MEGLDEGLTVTELPVNGLLRRTLMSTNPIENAIGRVRQVHRNVKPWRGATMAVRWAVMGLIEAARTCKRIKGATDMRALVNALRARDEKLGLPVSTAA